MRRFIVFLPILALCGCAYLHSTTSRTTDAKTGVPIEQTSVRVYTLWDATSQLTKFSNRSGYTTNGSFGPGTYATGLNESSTSTNINELIGIIIGAAVKAAAKP